VLSLSLTTQLHTYQLIHGQVPALAPSTPIQQPYLLALEAALHSALTVWLLLLLTALHLVYQPTHGPVQALVPNTPIPQPYLPPMDTALHSVLTALLSLSLTT
jgi:hypothetical protein